MVSPRKIDDPPYREPIRPSDDGPLAERDPSAVRGRVDIEIERIGTKTFPIVRRGYDRQEVHDFLRAVADEYRKVVRAAKDAVNTAREEAALAEARARQAPAPVPAASAGPGVAFEDIGGRVAAVLSSAAEAAEDIKATAERDAAAVLQQAREESEQLRHQARAQREDFEQRRAESEQEADAILADARAAVDSMLAEAESTARRLERESEQRVAALERTARANIEAVLAEARRDYEHLRSVQQQCIDRLASVEFLAKNARDGLSEGAGQSLDELL